MECTKCSKPIHISDDPVVCEGGCGARFHCNCSQISKIAARMINESKNIIFTCDKCVYKSNITSQSINELVKNAVDDGIRKLSSEIKMGIENVMKEVSVLVDNKLRLIRHDSIDALVTKSQQQDGIEQMCDNKPLSDKLLSSEQNSEWITMRKKRKRTRSDDRETLFPISTQGNKNCKSPEIRSNKKLKNIEIAELDKQRNLLILPKIAQSSDVTRADLEALLDPSIHKIVAFRNGKAGQVYMEFENEEERNKVKETIDANLISNYISTSPIKTQNEGIPGTYIEVLGVHENRDMKYKRYSVLLKVDGETGDFLIKKRKVYIGFERCNVFESFHVLRCYKCAIFGHKSDTCLATETCSKCCGQHRTDKCDSDIKKCANCVKFNEETKSKLNTDHEAYNNQCPTFRKLLERNKKRGQ